MLEGSMDINMLVNSLGHKTERNDVLRFLESIVVNPDQQLTDTLALLINEPTSIENTNRFASLLVELPSIEYISPLTEVILNATPEDSPWLTDYMYTLGSLLGESDEEYVPSDDFVHKLGAWLSSTGGGELSWKAGIILAEVTNPVVHNYLFQGARDSALFHQTRITCIKGIVNNFRDEAEMLLSELTEDPEKYVREAAYEALEWLKEA